MHALVGDGALGSLPHRADGKIAGSAGKAHIVSALAGFFPVYIGKPFLEVFTMGISGISIYSGQMREGQMGLFIEAVKSSVLISVTSERALALLLCFTGT